MYRGYRGARAEALAEAVGVVEWEVGKADRG